MVKKPLASMFLPALTAALFFGCPGSAEAEEFSFYGARFGMTREEVGTGWLLLGDGKYAVSSPAVTQIEPRFDHEGQLYQVSFSVILTADDPSLLVSSAFQQLVDSKWGRLEPSLDTTLP